MVRMLSKSNVSLMDNLWFCYFSANFEYATHEILEFSRSIKMAITNDVIRHLIFVLNKHATLFYEEIFRQNKKQNQLIILWTKTAAAVYIRLFPEGVWVEKIGNILKHASASQHVQMLGVRKFKRIVSLPNSPLFQVLDAKISFLKGIPDNINCRNFAEIFPLTCGE